MSFAIFAGIARELGGSFHDLGTREGLTSARHSLQSETHQSHVILGPIKGKATAAEKVDAKYEGDASKLRDVVRATVAVPHVDDLAGAVETVRRNLPKGWTIRSPENRYVEGRKGDRVNTGHLNHYRDIAVLVTSPDGFVHELQINTTHMVAAKEGVGHKLYEQRRAITRTGAKADLSRADLHRVKMIDQNAGELYGRAMVRSTRSLKTIA